MIGYTTAQVKVLTGLSTRQINYFDQTGLLRPSVQKAKGKGSLRYYSFRDLVALKMIAVLREKSGVSLQAIRKAVDEIQHIEGRMLSEVVLAVVGDDIVEILEREEFMDLGRSLVKNPGQLVYLFIDVGTIYHTIQQAVSNVG
jgi:DNA-binding transcriptional MerR regulator